MQKVQTELDMQTIRETTYFKSMDAAFKVGLTIYVENNLKKVPTTFTYLSQVLAEDVDKKEIIRAIDALGDWGLAEAKYGATHDGRAGRIMYLTWMGEQQFERNYKEIKKTLKK